MYLPARGGLGVYHGAGQLVQGGMVLWEVLVGQGHVELAPVGIHRNTWGGGGGYKGWEKSGV